VVLVALTAIVGLALTTLGSDRSSPDEAADTNGAAPPASTPAPDPLEELDTTVEVEAWEQLADCESGEWTADGDPEPDSAQWDYGLDAEDGAPFQGGLHFAAETWEAFRDPDMPDHAGRATPVEEIEVAERVLDEQGWDAWPVCSEKLGLDA
jgi:resuscitation-promoting factor RpfA